MSSNSSPILIIAFNRVDTLEKVLSKCFTETHRRIYISVDGPRKYIPQEELKVNKVKEVIRLFKGEFNGTVKVNYNEVNLGCKRGVVGAINWFFENEKYGIILEDDCVPNQSFFQFADILLDKYENHESILHIGGTNPISDYCTKKESYYFSNYNRIWGWATWKRAWINFDVDNDPRINHHNLLLIKKKLPAKIFENYMKIWDDVYNDKIDTWDYQWFLYRLTKGIAIIPNYNLITNIGFGEDATHTTNKKNKLANMKIESLDFPLIHPQNICVNRRQDRIWERKALKQNKIKKLLWNIIYR